MSKKIRSLPTILGLLVLILGVAAGIYLINRETRQLLQASPEIIPKQIKITNLKEDGLTISWITDSPAEGFVKYDHDKDLAFIAKDERDEPESSVYLTHHVTLKNLDPDTLYFFKIFSAGKAFDKNGQEYQIKTAQKIQAVPAKSDVAYGTVVDQNNQPINGVIVYLTLPDGSPQSSLTTDSGKWAIPLNLARSVDLSHYLDYDQENSVEEIFVQGGNLGTSTVVAVTKNDSPLSTITLGKSSDFSKTAQTLPESNQATSNQLNLEITGTPSGKSNASLEITSPEQGEKVSTANPEFMGIGPAGEEITIVVNSPEYSDTIIIDEDGNWNWSPPENLPPGEHSITITLPGGDFITHFFTVLAAEGDLPSFTATPSATVTPTLTLTPSPRPTLVASPSPTPTATITPTPSTTSAVPVSGTLGPTVLFALAGLLIVVFSLVLLL